MLILDLNLIILSDLLHISQYIEKNSQNFKKFFKILVLKTPSFYLRIIVENVHILYFELILWGVLYAPHCAQDHKNEKPKSYFDSIVKQIIHQW